MSLESINPFNLEKIKSYPEMSSSQIQTLLEDSQNAFHTWRKTQFQERAECFRKLASLLKSEADEHSFLITQEMGKLLGEAKAEVLKCATVCEYYAANAENFLKEQKVSEKSFISYQPLGVILSIMPWNFPFWQVLRFAAPTLMAGNTAVLKHASNVSGSAIALERLFKEAGFSPNVFRTLLVSSKSMETVIANPIVQAISLTGSTEAGKSVASLAGQYLKKCVLELGGSDPYIVCEDADLNLAVDLCFKTRIMNAGQSCISGKRFIIHASIYEQFKSQLLQKMKDLETGDPLLPSTTLAPLASLKFRDQLHTQVLQAIDAGAKLVLGGDYPLARGAFYNPTILENISTHNPAYVQEFFGPVACLYTFEKIEEAIEIANGTPFGLGAGILTSNSIVGEKIAKEEIQAGSCFVNSFVRSSPELPFGGMKQSGYGRELSSFGIYEFVNIKTVSIA